MGDKFMSFGRLNFLMEFSFKEIINLRNDKENS